MHKIKILPPSVSLNVALRGETAIKLFILLYFLYARLIIIFTLLNPDQVLFFLSFQILLVCPDKKWIRGIPRGYLLHNPNPNKTVFPSVNSFTQKTLQVNTWELKLATCCLKGLFAVCAADIAQFICNVYCFPHSDYIFVYLSSLPWFIHSLFYHNSLFLIRGSQGSAGV